MIQKYLLAFTFPSTNKVLRLKKSQNCRQDASLSFITSAAFFIVESLPFLRPPITVKGDWPEINTNIQQPLENGIYHLYTQLWNDLIIKRVTQGFSVLIQREVYFSVELEQKDFEKVCNCYNLYQQISVQAQFQKMNKLEKIFNLPQLSIKHKKMAIFNTHPNNPLGYPFAPRIHMPSLLLGLLYNNEQWSIFDMNAGEIPTVQQISQLSGIIFPGSSLSVLQQHPNMKKTLQNLDKAVQINLQLKIFGVCFGHQLLAQHFKAKVQKKQRKAGLQTIDINQQIIKKYGFLNHVLSSKNKFTICQHHQDFVIEVPKGFLLLGKSQSCEVQSLISENGRILTTQFHSEFFIEYFMQTGKRFQYFYKNENMYRIPKAEPKKVQESIVDSKLWLQCIRHFFYQ